MFILTNSAAADRLLPLPKPSVDLETKKITEKKKIIYPQQKPREKIELKDEIDPTQEIEQVAEEEVFIYPEKKPIIVKKKIDKSSIKSTILSKKDFATAKSIFKLIDKKKWHSALKLSEKSRNRTLDSLVNYLYLIRPSNNASFFDYLSFINSNPDYPRINRLKYLAFSPKLQIGVLVSVI